MPGRACSTHALPGPLHVDGRSVRRDQPRSAFGARSAGAADVSLFMLLFWSAVLPLLFDGVDDMSLLLLPVDGIAALFDGVVEGEVVDGVAASFEGVDIVDGFVEGCVGVIVLPPFDGAVDEESFVCAYTKPRAPTRAAAAADVVRVRVMFICASSCRCDLDEAVGGW